MTSKGRRIYDHLMFFFAQAIAIGWLFQGHVRDAVILSTVAYWGLPWSRWRAHLESFEVPEEGT